MGNWVLARSAQIGGGVIELVLSLVLVFFFYRDGPRLALLFEHALERLIGERAAHYRQLIAGTVQRVVNGVIGTAAAQAFNSYSSSERRLIQRRLSSYGYYRGGIDGSFGPGTYSAVVAYAQDEGESLRSTASAFGVYDSLIY